MKNLILSAFLLLTVATSAFAIGESNVSYFVLNSFKRDFKGVSSVTWTSKTGMAKASFVYNNRKMEAFYHDNGSLFGTSTSIEPNELPVNAKRVFAKKYQGYEVKEAIEYDSQQEKNYYLSAENERESIIIKIDHHVLLTTFKRIKK